MLFDTAVPWPAPRTWRALPQALLLLAALTQTNAASATTLGSVAPSLAPTQAPVTLSVSGTGFDEQTKFALYPDPGRRFVIGEARHVGTVWDVQIAGNLAYLASWGMWDPNLGEYVHGLAVVDLSEADTPKLITRLSTPQPPHELAIANEHVWVVDRGGLSGFDLVDPRSPTQVSRMELPGNNGVTIDDGIAWVRGDDGLSLVSLSEPGAPVLLQHLDDAELSWATALVVRDGIGFALAGWPQANQKLVVIDGRNPGSANSIAALAIPFGDGITLNGSYAYIASDEGILVIDVTVPSNPVERDRVTGAPRGALELAGERLLIAGRSAGVTIYSVEDPERPEHLGIIDPDGLAQQLRVIDNLAFVASHFAGLQVVDIAAAGASSVALARGPREDATALDVEDGLAAVAYYADAESGVSLYDTESLTDGPIGATGGLGFPVDLRLQDRLLFTLDFNRLTIDDVRDPAAPTRISTLDLPFGQYGSLEVEGSTAFVLYISAEDQSHRLLTIDVSLPSAPQIQSSLTFESSTHGMAVHDDLVYLAGRSGLTIYDLSDPATPRLLGIFETNWSASSVVVEDSVAYVYARGLFTIDVTDPSAPARLGYADLETCCGGDDLSLDGDLLYVASGSADVQVVDVGDPTAPSLLGTIDVPGEAGSIETQGDGVVLVTGRLVGLVAAPAPLRIVDIERESATRATLRFQSPAQQGHYTLAAYGHGDASLPGAVSFEDRPSRSLAIIVAGGGPYEGNNLWPATVLAANYAWQVLRYQGYSREDIVYLSPDPSVDPNLDGIFDEVTGPATGTALQNALANVTITGGVDELLLFVVDHGGNSVLRLNQTEELAASELDDWLDELQESFTGRLVVIYDACQSGTFLPHLDAPDGARRILVTSAGDQNAIFANAGRLSFSYQFWASVFSGGSLLASFNTAVSLMAPYQTPLLEADGNGVANEKDDRRVARDVDIGRGYVAASDRPLISAVSAPDFITSDDTGPATLTASGIIDATRVVRVWAGVSRPDFSVASRSTPIIDLPVVELTDSDGDGTWSAEWDGFDTDGRYDLTFHAENENGFSSVPSDAFPNRATVIRSGAPATNTAPAIGLLGESTYRLEAGETFVDPGYLAWDREDGLLTEGVSVAGAVDTSLVGRYEITYRVADTSGATTSVTRTIEVNDRDADGDGLPDAYEQSLGLDASDPADAGADPDGDGLTTRLEYELGTNPLSADGVDARLRNISTRGRVGAGDDVLIGGVIIEGDAPKAVTVRARAQSIAFVSPSLADRLLVDPELFLYDAEGVLLDSNDNWQAHPDWQNTPAHLRDMAETDAAITLSLPPGAYTAIVRGAEDTSEGVAIVEVFEID